MPGFSNAGKGLMLDAMRSAISHISLHSSTPGSNGANELAAANDYARWAVTTADFNSTSEGAFTTNKDHEFSSGASQAVTHIGLWQSSTFLGGGAITGDTAFNAEGAFILKEGTSINLNAT